MKTDYCLLLLLGSAASLAAYTKEQDSSARSPESPNSAPEGNAPSGADSPTQNVDQGSEDRMGPNAPGGREPSPTPGPGGPGPSSPLGGPSSGQR